MMFVYAALAGFGLGAVYDVLRLLRILCGESIPPRSMCESGLSVTGMPKRTVLLHILLFAEDVLFAVVVSVTLLLLLYYTNDGQLRAPAVIGMACGFFVYYHTVGRLVIRCAALIVRALKAAVSAMLRLLWWPIRRLGRWLGRVMRALWCRTVGRLWARHCAAETERRIRALVESAAHGFGAEDGDG